MQIYSLFTLSDTILALPVINRFIIFLLYPDCILKKKLILGQLFTKILLPEHTAEKNLVSRHKPKPFI